MSRLSSNQAPNVNCVFPLKATFTMTGSSAGSTFSTAPSVFRQQYNCSAPHGLIGNVTRVTTTSFSNGQASISGTFPISVTCCSNTQLAFGSIAANGQTPGLNYSGTPVVLTVNTVTTPETFCPDTTGAPQTFPPFGSSSSSEDGGAFSLGLVRDNTGQFFLNASYDSSIGILSVSSMKLGTEWADVWGSYSFTSSNGLTADNVTNNSPLQLSITLSPPTP